MQYSEFQSKVSSEKIVLATLEASKRLMGWTVHSGSVYKLENFPHNIIASIEDSGTAYTEVGSVGAVIASTFFLDRDTHTLYLRTTGSDNPNSRFLACVIKLFFANVPVALPHDLDSGDEVFFEPMIASTSNFGVEIDTINQTSEAIEGGGSLSLKNDFEFWPAYFDKLVFENQRCTLYSYHRELPVSEAQMLFKGRIESKTYGSGTISFKLKDTFAELRAPLTLPLVSSLGGRTGSDINNTYVRSIFGRVFGHVPINIDQELDGYPITGTISAVYNSETITGVGTEFLSELSPDDKLIIDDEEYTVATVDSDTSLTLTEVYSNSLGASGVDAYVRASEPKRWYNRIFKVANHTLREPVTQTIAGSRIDKLMLDDASDIFPGDVLYVGALGSGETVVVESITGSKLVKLTTTLAVIPPIGTEVRRPAIQNVRIDDTLLEYYRDYTFNASTAVLTLRNSAEANASNIRQMASTLTFTNGSRTVTSSENVDSIIKPGYMIGVVGNADFFEVLHASGTTITLRTAATFSDTEFGRYKALVYDHGNTTLSLDAIGRTEDGTTDGTLLRTAPQIVKALIEDVGLGSIVNEDSFSEADILAPQDIGVAIPTNSADTKAPIYRDVINLINKSVFGSLIQTNEFEFAYHVLMPRKTQASVRFRIEDIITWSLEATAENAVKTSIVEYRPKEFDYLIQKSSISTQQKTSEGATYLLKTERTRTFPTYLVEELDAEIMANRWAFLLETSSGKLTLNTKLQGVSLEVGNIIEVEHSKFFERFGGTGKRKLLLVESVKKNGLAVSIEAVDLSNTFNRVACINENSNEYADATEEEKLYGGFITDEYGLIDDDSNSFETNLIW